jgi:hypothetical protein
MKFNDGISTFVANKMPGVIVGLLGSNAMQTYTAVPRLTLLIHSGKKVLSEHRMSVKICVILVSSVPSSELFLHLCYWG